MKAEKEELFAGLKEVPEGFFEMIKRDEERENLIYYQRDRKKASYYCCQCGNGYTKIFGKSEDFLDAMYSKGEKPERGATETCMVCGQKGKLEWKKCAGIKYERVTYRSKRYFIWQTDVKGNLVIREFMRKTRRSIGSEMSSCTYEVFRAFLAPGMCKAYGYSVYGGSWHETGRKINTDAEMVGITYGDCQGVLASSKMQYFQIGEYTKIYRPDTHQLVNDGVKMKVIIACARTPAIEMIHKIGMDTLARETIRNDGVCGLINKRGKTIEKVLRVKKEDIRWILRQEDEIAALRACQTVRKGRMKANDKTRDRIYRLVFKDRYPGHIEKAFYLLGFMSIEQLENRCRRYAEEYGGRADSAMGEYADYIKMRKGLGYDMANEIYLKPKSLKGAYAQLKKEEEARRNKGYINQMMEKYPDIEKRYEKADRKYSYESGGLMVRPARNAGEIVLEGRTLHHCVGSDTQRYMRNHNEGKRFILFLRRKEYMDAPYITIEIDNEFNVQQWYGANDTKPEKEEIEAFLEEYRKEKTKQEAT